MKMITITCPNCGGNAQRKEDEYFAKCPYCGAEIGFDELKEEAADGVYRKKTETLQNRLEDDARAKKQLSDWLAFRNVCFVIVALCHFIGFSVFARFADTENETAQWIGILFLIVAWTVGFLCLPLICIAYPEKDVLTGKRTPGVRLLMAVKVTAVSLMLCISTCFAAYLIIAK